MRPAKERSGRGRISVRACGYIGPGPSMNPVSSALTIITDASSKRSRDSSIAIPWNGANSRCESPRPMPKRTRPPETMSSMATFSATRSGSFHGRMTAAVPRPIVFVRPAT